MVALGDSGFFLDHDGSGGGGAGGGEPGGAGEAAAGGPAARSPRYGATMRWLADLMASRGGADRTCVAAEGAAPWRCLFAATALRHVALPTFLVQPQYDSWQVR